MSTKVITKVSSQKVIALLQKAGYPICKGTHRYSSGYSVTGIYSDYPFVEVDYVLASRQYDSSTEARIGALVLAAKALNEAGVVVWIMPTGNLAEYNAAAGKLYIEKDSTKGQKFEHRVLYSEEEFVGRWQQIILREKSNTQRERDAKDEKRRQAQEAQAARMAKVLLLNPTIPVDLDYVPGLFVTHVTLMDGRMAVLTVASRTKQEIDWDATAETQREERYYNCFEIEISATYRNEFDKERWDTRRDTVTTSKGGTIQDAIRYWISQRW